MITGASMHNQKIERLWRDVFDGVIGFYYELFSFIKENGILDLFNQIDIVALHFTFIPLINEKLDACGMLGRNIISEQLKLHLYVSGLQVK